MPSRRNEITLSAEEEAAFLAEQPFGVLATVGPSGDPHLVTIGFADDGPDRIGVTSFRSAQKVVNARRQPRATFLVERTDPYDDIVGIMLRGRVEVLETRDEVAPWYHRIKQRTAGLVELDAMPTVDDDTLIDRRVAIVLHVDRRSSWDHRKLGGRY